MLDIIADPDEAAPGAAAQAFSNATARRSPPTAVQCVLPVWGYSFIRQFVDFGLPTMLAPGNIPALAAVLPCEFIILTSYDDEPFLRANSNFQALSRVCRTEIRLIDHLITGSNYSTTITLAYAEAVRAAGPAMLDTCFFLLVSDYVVADGSFRSALARVMQGSSGVLVGNFQVALEDALPWLREQLIGAPGALALPPRQLMSWALSHLHPATVANIVNYPLNHNVHTNRLFWRVDGETLLGRFYLMHMLCIRPELTDFVIGSSCDYSFIPEMCPSDNVEILGDSDDYLVIEMQSRAHESKFLRPGRLKPRALAKSLSEWTTARHRINSGHSVIFHSADVSKDRVRETEKAADGFLAAVRRSLRRVPRPHRDHPYWRGAIAAFNEAKGKRLAVDEWRLVLGLPDPANSDSWVSEWVVEKIRFLLYGRPPNVRPWHPRWLDYQGVIKALGGYFADPRQRLLMVSDIPTIFTASLADDGERAMRVQRTPFLEAPAEIFEPMFDQFDACLVELNEGDLDRCDELIDRVAPMMKAGSKIVIIIYNKRKENPEGFFASVSFHSPRLLRPSASSTGIRFLTASPFRWRVLDVMMRSARLASQRPVIGIPLLLVRGGYLSFACLMANMLSRGHDKATLRPGTLATSVLLELNIDGGASRETYKYSANRIVRQQQRRRRGVPDLPIRPEALRTVPWSQPAKRSVAGVPGRTAADSELVAETVAPPLATAAVPTTAQAAHRTAAPGLPGADESFPGETIDGAQRPMAEGTREQQYNRCVDLKNQFGLTSLGLMTNQVFYDDPRRLAILLARYKFVAKMLSGKQFVGEVGCGDAFGTRLVMQEVAKVVAYDFDPVFIEDIRQRQSGRWPIEAHVHDIVLNTLPHKHDGIYSLDVIEHISRMDEHAYLSNLRGSLMPDGVLIIGTPSLESQAYASPPSKAGHINCKRGVELKLLMQQYFSNVFLFSMNDEVVHTGFYPMAHYLLAMCCGSK